MTDLDSPLSPLVGQAAAKALAAQLDLNTVGELLRHYPRRYAERGKLTDLGSLAIGEHVTVMAEIRSVNSRPMRQRRGTLMEVVIESGGRTLSCTFFNRRYHGNLAAGRVGLFAGKVTAFRGKLQLNQPDMMIFGEDDDLDAVDQFAGALVPIYPATTKLPSWKIARCVRQVLDMTDAPTDPLPMEILAERGLPDLGTALRGIHRPERERDWRAARQRLVWDEALAVQLALAQRRQAALLRPAPACPPVPGGLHDAFDAQLPFTLTDGQREVGEEVTRDLAIEHPMNRLVQGDVGAGKTIVALRAMLRVVDAGRQAAMLAPTEVLAAQHARTLRELLGPLGRAGELDGADRATQVTLLTGTMSAKARKQALLDTVSGTAGIVVGTHALIQDRVEFADLGLLVVDEQHRFGVEQRDVLRGRDGGRTPHLLVMTATPIPRTVAMTVYGDLEVSALRELPLGRSPIATTVVPAGEKPAWLERAWERVREEVSGGHQAFVVCPRIGGENGGNNGSAEEDAELEPPDEDGDGEEKRRPPLAVADVAPMLAEGPLAGLRLGVLHGRLPADEKDAVMRAFSDGELDVLVATTVIEVGVDVPNATGMVIMDADRFGLSQLHQLRGRVGRGKAPGVCLLITDSPPGTTARARLDAVASTTDGFELARHDLELRREGDVLGASQSGRRSGLRLLSLLRDEKTISEAREVAWRLVAGDPFLERHAGLAGMVAEIIDEERAEYLEKA
ncbi:ATP-dependent DNA helicase RecG [Pseudonocardia acaciae]|uniref:ATP-dependent DNA helicase RecG n=1 Tax=Pseudonocardia acaciae TaxID=551276 RepID=UPI000490F0E0|nr:ATP-dependent DNA helicase RecG [Pseudonocardia acaciae]